MAFNKEKIMGVVKTLMEKASGVNEPETIEFGKKMSKLGKKIKNYTSRLSKIAASHGVGEAMADVVHDVTMKTYTLAPGYKAKKAAEEEEERKKQEFYRANEAKLRAAGW